MKNGIEKKETNRIRGRTLKPGQTFEYDGQYYFIPVDIDLPDLLVVAAPSTNLITGERLNHLDLMVYPLKLKFVLDEE